MNEHETLLARIRDEQVKIVDFRFTDLSGRWRNTTLDAASVDEQVLTHGLLIDGSAIPGWRDVNESDLQIKPDTATAFVDPFAAQATLVLLANAAEPTTGTGYERDPRSAAIRAEAWLAKQHFADRVRVGCEFNFFMFDSVRVDMEPLASGYRLSASEALGNRSHSDLAAEQFFAGGSISTQLSLPPTDHLADIRAEAAAILTSLGFTRVRMDHGAAPMQSRVSFANDHMVATADRCQLARYVLHQVASSYGKRASFMSYPLADQSASAMTVHQSLWREAKPVFSGHGYADLSPLCLNFIAGILKHARALSAFVKPTTNSYRANRSRHDEATMLTYAVHNRSAAIRIPYAAQPSGKRIEARFAEPCLNPYLGFTAILMAGLDGVSRKLEPGDAMDRNLYDLRADEIDDLPQMCSSFAEALDALEADHEFLLEGEIMSQDLIRAYIDVKRKEIDYVMSRPHPADFQLYFDF